jgi:mannosylglucosylglycerate synthase
VARVGVVSFRLGGADGVSIEAAKWCDALVALGLEVTTVAGEGPVDVLVPGLAIGASTPPTARELREALAGTDLVVVENLASLPLNPGARDVLYEVLDGRPSLFHHHDLAWQRPHLAHLEGPRPGRGWRHVTINELSRRELAGHGVAASVIMNSFDCDPPPGDREGTRRDLGVGHEPVVLMASRALARKNVPGAITLARALSATLWILGPAEDGYDDELARLLARADVEVRLGLPAGRTIHDAYGACDVVAMSSTWEGFGNPVLESVTHRRLLALNPYPVAREIMAFGFEFFLLGDATGLREALASPDERHFATNLAVARRHFNVADLPRRLAEVLDL